MSEMKDLTRRTFLAAPAAGAAALAADGDRLAIRGGTPVRAAKFPAWPRSGELEERVLLETLRSGQWGRTTGKKVEEFEQKYAQLTGARFCLATANGTSALLAALHALDAGPGDEILVPPYTFVATVNAVLVHHALPVFVDSNLETMQMDAAKIAAAVTERTTVVVPVHIGGAPADLDAVRSAAKAKKLRVLEDACQAHLGEWRGKKVGSVGDAGCFSFQASKNLNAGEGGAVITNDEEVMDRAYSFHSNGRARRASPEGLAYARNGANLRLTEFQAALLMAQMTRLEEQSRIRDQNAAHLTSLLSQIPGIMPAKLHEGCTRNAWHLYMFRYDAGRFAGASKAQFTKALAAEGIPCSGGYTPLNKEPFLDRVLQSKHYQRIYGEKRLKDWREQNQCPVNDRLCQQAVWFTQTMLLGTRDDMEQIAEAVRKIQRHAAELRA